MRLSNGGSFSVNLLPRLLVALRARLGLGVTFGEVARANGEGPCMRCVGRALDRDVPGGGVSPRGTAEQAESPHSGPRAKHDARRKG